MAQLLNYVGPSMHPTLEVGDGLTVLPYHGRRIRCGDVVVFPHPSNRRYVVHRVARADDQGIRTRGDNNAEDDPWLLQADQIIGQVLNVRRRDRQLILVGGLCGRMVTALARSRNRVNRTLIELLRPVYRFLSGRGVLHRWGARQGPMRIVQFNRPNGVELHLFLGRRQVGRLAPGDGQWQVRAPFRLLIDEGSLPLPTGLRAPDTSVSQ